jgi:hypothetical protein
MVEDPPNDGIDAFGRGDRAGSTASIRNGSGTRGPTPFDLAPDRPAKRPLV